MQPPDPGRSEIRSARPTDAVGIADVHIRAWRETYAHLIDPKVLASLDVASRAARWGELIAGDALEVWVATEDDTVIGWVSTSTRVDAARPRPLELEGIYVRASHHGIGVGQGLMNAAVGGSGAYLWSAAENPRALAFYGRNGFRRDGAVQTAPLAGTPVEIVRLVR